MTVTEAAWTMLQVANDKIAGSIRGRTVERGHDPRDFALVAYGGRGRCRGWRRRWAASWRTRGMISSRR